MGRKTDGAHDKKYDVLWYAGNLLYAGEAFHRENGITSLYTCNSAPAPTLPSQFVHYRSHVPFLVRTGRPEAGQPVRQQGTSCKVQDYRGCWCDCTEFKPCEGTGGYITYHHAPQD